MLKNDIEVQLSQCKRRSLNTIKIKLTHTHNKYLCGWSQRSVEFFLSPSRRQLSLSEFYSSAINFDLRPPRGQTLSQTFINVHKLYNSKTFACRTRAKFLERVLYAAFPRFIQISQSIIRLQRLDILILTSYFKFNLWKLGSKSCHWFPLQHSK